MRVIVAGAGVFGSCIALSLARAGVAVTVADPAALGDNASGVAAGMLAPAFESLFDRRLEHFERLIEARDMWPDFAASLGIEIERAGAVAVSFEEFKIEAWGGTLADLGVASTRLSSVGVGNAYPDLAEGLSALSVNTDWRLDAGRALSALKIGGERLGVIHRRSAVMAFTPGRVELDDGSTLKVDALVIATGASPSLCAMAPELASLTPIKGHIFQLRGAWIGSAVVRFEGGYLCPAQGGVLLGATMEVGRSDTAVDDVQSKDLVDTARLYAPDLDYASAVRRVGVRASTDSGLPLVGRAGAEGVWLAVGARRNGWLLAPTVARTIVDDVVDS